MSTFESLCLSIDEKDFMEVARRVHEFKISIRNFVARGKRSKVFTFNLHFFSANKEI